MGRVAVRRRGALLRAGSSSLLSRSRRCDGRRARPGRTGPAPRRWVRTGSRHAPLASHFEEVVGLDPDPGMIVEAKRRAAAAGTTNATWVQERAEALPAGLGRFCVVTFAASFHWMDRPRVAAAVKDMLEPGGAAVQVDGQHRPDELRAASACGELPHPLAPTEEVEELRRRGTRAGPASRTVDPQHLAKRRGRGVPGRRFSPGTGRQRARRPHDRAHGRQHRRRLPVVVGNRAPLVRRPARPVRR